LGGKHLVPIQQGYHGAPAEGGGDGVFLGGDVNIPNVSRGAGKQIHIAEDAVKAEAVLIFQITGASPFIHHHAGGVGFYFEGTPGEGAMMYADTLGVTRSGLFRYADRKITEKDIYRHAGHALATGRTGALRGTAEFDYEDTVGPYGHAAYAGIRHGRRHTFKLLARLDYFELYIDGLYVQTYLLPDTTTGRVGFYVSDGVCDVEINGFRFAKTE
jgi:hypothetical protein